MENDEDVFAGMRVAVLIAVMAYGSVCALIGLAAGILVGVAL